MKKIIIDNIFYLFVFIFILRIVYISVNRKIHCELIKDAGVLISSFFSLQYYNFIGNFIEKKVNFINTTYIDYISFLFIFLCIYSIFSITNKIFSVLFDPMSSITLERWIALFLGFSRAIFLLSIFLFSFYISPWKNKFFPLPLVYEKTIKPIYPSLYKIIFNKVYKKIYDRAKINKEVEKYYETKRDI